MLSERIRKHQDYKPPLQASEVLLRDTCGQWADQVAKLERVARAAKEVISWMDESGPGVEELMAALADLPEDALGG